MQNGKGAASSSSHHDKIRMQSSLLFFFSFSFFLFLFPFLFFCALKVIKGGPTCICNLGCNENTSSIERGRYLVKVKCRRCIMIPSAKDPFTPEPNLGLLRRCHRNTISSSLVFCSWSYKAILNGTSKWAYITRSSVRSLCGPWENIIMKCTNHVQGDSYVDWVPNIPWLHSQGPRLLSIVIDLVHH